MDFVVINGSTLGGLLAPVSMSHAPEMQSLIDKIGIDAYNYYMQILNQTHPVIKEGAVKVPTYFENHEDSGLEPYVGKVMQPAKDVVLDFGNGTTRSMVVYDDGIFMNIPGLMKSLRQTLEGKVKFEQHKITSFDEISTPIIVNCSGLGARDLNNDQKMVSVHGHFIIFQSNYMDHNPKILVLLVLHLLKMLMLIHPMKPNLRS